MTEKLQSKGTCRFCRIDLNKTGMTRHLKSCNQRAAQIDQANNKKNRQENIFHLQIQDAYQGDYWLHLEMSGATKLTELDNYLRAIWLECCGHLSQFSHKKWGEEISMTLTANQVFTPGIELYHIYDFGSSSETKIKVAAERNGSFLTSKPIFLMARNEPPEYLCEECGKPATWLCIECIYEYESEGTYCDKHAESHPHDDYGEPVEIVNSPRLGVCGYTGPADPPY